MRKTLLALAIGLITAVAVESTALAQQRFKTPQEAADALVAAARAADNRALITVLGRDGAEITASGDRVQDEEIRKLFVAAYDIKHDVSMAGDKATMLLGNSDWPFPIPLIKKNDAWVFDTVAGREEILARRIGRNELATIQACLAYVDAQNEYGARGTYAQRIISSPGKKDGLYWPTAAGEPSSPLGEEVAHATLRGYRVGGGKVPYNGYYFKILAQQGPTAPGGEMDYIVRGKMIGGFALVAYPAQYGNSGVMTFLVNHNGDVFEKDLGPNTAKVASRMIEYNPDRTWRKAADTVPPPN
ncbi:MAG TPA: DUF2950 domain-containing protein [Pseudolabrys sp.]|jgi:hypothetical protein